MWHANINRRKGTDSSSYTKKAHRDARIATTVDEVVQRRHEQLAKMRDEVPALRAQIDKMRQRCTGVVGRHTTRMRADAERHARIIEAECNVRESLHRELKFQMISSLYTKAFKDAGRETTTTTKKRDIACVLEAETSDKEDERRTERIVTTPGVPTETRAKLVTTSSAREASRTHIVQELIVHTDESAPKLVVKARDECPFCHVALLLNGPKSMLVCTTCGYTLPYLDSTTQNLSYSDEYELGSFSYKRHLHFEELLKTVQGGVRGAGRHCERRHARALRAASLHIRH